MLSFFFFFFRTGLQRNPRFPSEEGRGGYADRLRSEDEHHIGCILCKLFSPFLNNFGEEPTEAFALSVISFYLRKVSTDFELLSTELSKWSHFRISSTDSNVRTSLHSIIIRANGKYNSVAFI